MLKYFCVHYIFCAKSKLCALENDDYKKCKKRKSTQKDYNLLYVFGDSSVIITE